MKTSKLAMLQQRESTWRFGAAALIVVLLVILGLRATTPYSAAHLEAITKTSQALKLGAPLQMTLEGAHPGITWLMALLSHLSGLSPATTARGVELLMAAAVTALTWSLARRLTDRLGAAIALILLWGSPLWLGMASVTQTTMTMSALLLSLIALMSLPNPRLRDDLMLALVAAMLWLSWPVAALIGALLALLKLKSPSSDEDSTPRAGLLARPTLTLGTLLALLGSLPLATLLHPGLWQAPLQGWQLVFEHTLLKPTLGGGLYRGQTIGALRLPWYAGPDLLLWQGSLPLLILGLGGALGFAATRLTKQDPSPTKAALTLTLGVLILSPWWSADAMTGMASLVAMTTPLLAILGAPLARQALVQGWRRFGTGRAATAAMTSALLLICLAGPMSAATAWPYLGATWAPWRGGLGGALKAQMPAQYDEALPVSVIKEAQRQGCAVSLALKALSSPALATPANPKCVIERQVSLADPKQAGSAALGVGQVQLFTRSDY